MRFGLNGAHVQHTKSGPAHWARAFLLQPHLLFVLILTRRKPFGQTIHTPHGTTKTISASFTFGQQQSGGGVLVSAMLLQFYVWLRLHARKAWLQLQIGTIRWIGRNQFFEGDHKAFENGSIEGDARQNGDGSTATILKLTKIDCIHSNYKRPNAGPRWLHRYADVLHTVRRILRNVVRFALRIFFHYKNPLKLITCCFVIPSQQ